MKYTSAILALGCVFALAACERQFGSTPTQLRSGPQTESPSGGADMVSPGIGTMIPIATANGPTEVTGSSPVAPAMQPAAGNEYNRNADIYRAGFQGAMAVALAR